MRGLCRTVLTACTLAGMLVATGCSSAESSGGAAGSIATMDPITIAVAEVVNERHSTGVALKAFTDEVTARTAGKVRFEIYWSGSLVPGTEALDAVGGGLAQIGAVTPAYFPQDLPLSQWSSGLVGEISSASPHGVLQGAPTVRELFAQPELAAEFEDYGVHVLSASVTGPQAMLCSRPSLTPAQTAGLRVRTAGSIWNAEAEALGMTPVTLPPGEIFDAMQRGVIDCAVGATAALTSYGLWEIADYYTPVGMTAAIRVTGVNRDVWNRLPEEAQKIMEDAVPTYLAEVARAEFTGDQAMFAPGGPAEGATLQSPTELGARVDGVQSDRVAAMAAGAADVPGATPDLVGRFTDSSARWLSLVTEDMGVAVPRLDSSDAIRQSYLDAASTDFAQWAELLRTKSAQR
jgi:TRAP-type C4-dicarboxylate transport system substrate-binding protein